MNLREIGDLNLLTALIWGEARGEPIEGKVGVAWVVRNRVMATRWGGTYPDVILQKKQFSCFNIEDPNHHKVLGAITPTRNGNWQNQVYRECRWVANGVLNDWIQDNVKGANHYHAKGISPYWTEGHLSIEEKGDHLFYRI